MRIRAKDWLIPGSGDGGGRRYYATAVGLRAYFCGRRRLWVYERFDSAANGYVETGSTRHFQPHY